MRSRVNPLTGAFVHSYEPIRCYIYAQDDHPRRSINFLARVLLFPRAREFGGAYLFERVGQRSRAHFILPSFDVNWFAGREAELLDHLSLQQDDGSRHLLVDSRDEPTALPVAGAVSLKTSVRQKAAAEHVICIPYIDTVDDSSYLSRAYRREYEYGSSFVGGATPRRTSILARLEAQARFPYFFQTRDGCFLDRHLRADAEPYTRAQAIERRRSRECFLRSASRSRYILALPGFGANTSRFFESLSLGVAPILVAGNAALPFSQDIPYADFSFCISDNLWSAARVATTIISLIEDHWDQAATRGRLGRLYYDAYLSRANLLYHLHALLSATLS
jgi:hypothetical protein